MLSASATAWPPPAGSRATAGGCSPRSSPGPVVAGQGDGARCPCLNWYRCGGIRLFSVMTGNPSLSYRGAAAIPCAPVACRCPEAAALRGMSAVLKLQYMMHKKLTIIISQLVNGFARGAVEGDWQGWCCCRSGSDGHAYFVTPPVERQTARSPIHPARHGCNSLTPYFKKVSSKK